MENWIFGYNQVMDKSVRQTRTRHLREVELLIWLLIVLALFAIGFYLYSAKQKTYELHNIFMQDVDGLIVGSPVNLMVVPIGYVNKLKIVSEDEVFVRFIVKDKSVKLPKGTIANIEFSGLGGSKSLELYPPNPEIVQRYGLDADDYIIVTKTNRLRDCWVLLYEMFNKVGLIIARISSFGAELQSSNLQEDTVMTQKDVNKFIEFSNGWVDNVQKDLNDYKNKMNDMKKGNRDDSHD